MEHLYLQIKSYNKNEVNHRVQMCEGSDELWPLQKFFL